MDREKETEVKRMNVRDILGLRFWRGVEVESGKVNVGLPIGVRLKNSLPDPDGSDFHYVPMKITQETEVCGVGILKVDRGLALRRTHSVKFDGLDEIKRQTREAIDEAVKQFLNKT